MEAFFIVDAENSDEAVEPKKSLSVLQRTVFSLSNPPACLHLKKGRSYRL